MFILILKENNPHIQEAYFYRKKNNKTQIFTFNTPQAAQKCIEFFQQFAINKIMQHQHDSAFGIDPFAMGNVMHFCNAWELKELTDKDHFDCELVSFENILKEEKGIEI